MFLTVVATAYCLGGLMATGIPTFEGAIAVDPGVIPLRSKVLINRAPYWALDTGGNIQGNRIDIWMPSCAKAIAFGKQLLRIKIK